MGTLEIEYSTIGPLTPSLAAGSSVNVRVIDARTTKSVSGIWRYNKLTGDVSPSEWRKLDPLELQERSRKHMEQNPALFGASKLLLSSGIVVDVVSEGSRDALEDVGYVVEDAADVLIEVRVEVMLLANRATLLWVTAMGVVQVTYQVGDGHTVEFERTIVEHGDNMYSNAPYTAMGEVLSKCLSRCIDRMAADPELARAVLRADG